MAITSTNPAPKPAAARSSSSSTTLLNLETCSAFELSEYLSQHRFGGSASATENFLRDALTQVQSNNNNNNNKTTTTTISTNKNTEDTTTSSIENELLQASLREIGEPILDEPVEVSINTPRLGKFQLTLHEHGLHAQKSNDTSIQLFIPKSMTSHVILFPKPEDCGSKGRTSKTVAPAHFTLICTHGPPIKVFNQPKKDFTQLCFQLPFQKGIGAAAPPLEDDFDDIISNDQDATSVWQQAFAKSLAKDDSSTVVTRIYPKHRVTDPNIYAFSSFVEPGTSSTTGEMPFVRCYHGVNDGALYPLQEGLLFFKPPLFVPRSTLRSIACGRGSSSSNSSRYVDMILTRSQGHDNLEFNNIQREEVGVLNSYIHGVLIPAMQRDVQVVEENKRKIKNGKNDDNNNDDETEDEDNSNSGIPQVKVENVDDDDDDNDEQEAVAYEDNGDDETEDDDTDEEDENYEMVLADENYDDHVLIKNGDDVGHDDDDDDDDDDGFEIVRDDFAQELARKRGGNDDSGTESEEDQIIRNTRSSRRKRQRR